MEKDLLADVAQLDLFEMPGPMGGVHSRFLLVLTLVDLWVSGPLLGWANSRKKRLAAAVKHLPRCLCIVRSHQIFGASATKRRRI